MAEAKEVMLVTENSALFLFKDLYELNGIKRYIINRPRNRWQSILSIISKNKICKKLRLNISDCCINKDYIVENIPLNGYMLINSYPMTLASIDFWLDIKEKRPDAKFVLLLVDSIGVTGGHMDKTGEYIKKIKWDIILSYDINDCNKYGFRYIGLNYYSPVKIKENVPLKYDLYYVSSPKPGKERILQDINKACIENNLKILFQIVAFWRKIRYGKCIRRFLSYDEIIKNIEKSNCILEVLQKGQNMQSIRYLEAVCYRKKLLTNNENIVNYPYYNEKYMKTFKTVDDIDWTWVMKQEKVDYGDYDFSSKKLLDYIN